jgi:hypothetical protein
MASRNHRQFATGTLSGPQWGMQSFFPWFSVCEEVIP